MGITLQKQEGVILWQDMKNIGKSLIVWDWCKVQIYVCVVVLIPGYINVKILLRLNKKILEVLCKFIFCK